MSPMTGPQKLKYGLNRVRSWAWSWRDLYPILSFKSIANGMGLFNCLRAKRVEKVATLISVYQAQLFNQGIIYFGHGFLGPSHNEFTQKTFPIVGVGV